MAMKYEPGKIKAGKDYPDRWVCGCGQFELRTHDNAIQTNGECLCDDCHVSMRIMQGKEETPGRFNKFNENGAVDLSSDIRKSNSTLGQSRLLHGSL